MGLLLEALFTAPSVELTAPLLSTLLFSLGPGPHSPWRCGILTSAFLECLLLPEGHGSGWQEQDGCA